MPKRPFHLLFPALLLLPPLASLTGGWAVITVEDLPDYLVAGNPVTLAFTVRQHGVSPMDKLRPKLEARAGRTEATAMATAGKAAGQYLATFTPTEAGAWTITIRSGFGNSDLKLLPIRAVAANAGASNALAETERGEQLFVAKGCVSCHVRDELKVENGPAIGPVLSGKRYPVEFLQKFLADPASAGPPRYGAGPMPNLDLKQQEIAALMAFINR